MRMARRAKSNRGKTKGRVALLVFLVVVLATAGWCRWVYVQIESYANKDEAAPSDAIGVFGAAEYDGRPSPVFRARLDHALDLYHHGIAPLIITLGGEGGDEYSEGSVGREYLMGMGVPEAAIARANGLHRLVIVSDGTHLFRIHAICAADGLDVLTSPRPTVPIEGRSGDFARLAHEVLSYTLWRVGLH